MGGALMGFGGLGIAIGLVVVVAAFGASPYRVGELERISRMFLGASLAGSGLGVLALGYLIAAVDAIKEGVLRMSPAPQQLASDGSPIKKESFF
jgi:hypothetical protein